MSCKYSVRSSFPFLSLYTQKSKALKRKDPAEEFLAMYNDSPPSVIHCDKNVTVAELKWEIQDLKKENANLRELLVQGITSYHLFNNLTAKTLSSYFIL